MRGKGLSEPETHCASRTSTRARRHVAILAGGSIPTFSGRFFSNVHSSRENTMVKKTAKSIAVQPSRGEKITFDETSQEDSTPIVASTSSHSAPGPEHDDPAEQSEDDAPEAMGLSDVKAVEMKEVELVNQ